MQEERQGSEMKPGASGTQKRRGQKQGKPYSLGENRLAVANYLRRGSLTVHHE